MQSVFWYTKKIAMLRIVQEIWEKSGDQKDVDNSTDRIQR